MTSVLIVGMDVVPPVALNLLSDDRRSRSARVPSMPAALIDAFALTRRRGSSNRCFLHLRVAGAAPTARIYSSDDSYAP